jgi:hypothetical protein
VSVDDRIRTAIQATAATVREIPPLALPADEPDLAPPDLAQPGPARQRAQPPRPGRRGWGNWLIPLAAAVAVIAVAVTLVAVRGLGAGHASGPVPTQTSGAPASLPRYGVALTQTTARMLPKWGGAAITVSDLSVIDTHTGKRVALVKHPANYGFTAVSGAADDRTFALDASSYNLEPLPGTGSMVDVRSFYLLRIAPGSSQSAKLTRLSIPVQPGDATVDGFALSPDGRTLAVMEWCTTPGACYRGSPGTLRLYSVATGQAERTWTWGALPYPIPAVSGSDSFSNNDAGLTWLAGGRTLAFTYYAHGQAPVVRTLDTTRQGGDLVAASRPVFTPPASGPDACRVAMLTADGRTVVCAAQYQSGKAGTLEIDAYSAATGRRERVLYRYTTKQTTLDGIGALGWVGPGNTVVAMTVAGTLPPSGRNGPFQAKVITGTVTQGKLTPVAPANLPFNLGPGSIAF